MSPLGTVRINHRAHMGLERDGIALTPLGRLARHEREHGLPAAVTRHGAMLRFHAFMCSAAVPIKPKYKTIAWKGCAPRRRRDVFIGTL